MRKWLPVRNNEQQTMSARSQSHYDAGTAIAPAPSDHVEMASLQAVVVPLTNSQLDEAETNFAAWQEQLTPLSPTDTAFADLILVLNTGDTSAAEQLAQSAPAVQTGFRSVHVLSADLQGADDAYKIGDATGANNLFFFTLGALRNYSVFLLMETDCQPMRPGWLSDARACVDTQMGTKWVLGAQYRGDGPMAEEFWRHVNGNAFYRSGSTQFQSFYRDEFLPFYGDQYDNHDYRFGYDAGHERFLRSSPDRKRARSVLSKFGHTDFIVNLRSHDDDSHVPRGEGMEGVLWHRGGWMKRETA